MQIGRYLKTILIVLPFASALGVFADWQHDNALLRQQAVKITANLNTDSERIRAINDWVYQNKGFGKNNHHFILAPLGPTPLQVLEFGGDCSDKSRLVAAMLTELDVEAGLVMVSPCPNCAFIHTVVEAQYEGGRMVVDPIWHVDYPTGDGRFLGVRDLAGTSRGRERIAELQRERGPSDKIAGMPTTEATFDYAVAINWDKNMATRAVAAALHLLGYTPEQMFRPKFIEDPKLALSLLLVCTGITIVGANVVIFLLKVVGRRIRGPGETAPPASLRQDQTQLDAASVGRDQVVHRGGDTTLAVRHAAEFERHFNRRERAEDHRLVQIAKMADAENVAFEPVEPARRATR